LPVIGELLAAAVERWSRNGRLYASARDLPPMEDMPEHRVHAVITGRHVVARGADFDRLRRVVHRATDLSTGLVDAPTRARSSAPPNPTGGNSRHSRALGAPERLLDRAHATARTSIGTSPAPSAPPGDVRRSPQRDI
jgi:hypothetical protein